VKRSLLALTILILTAAPFRAWRARACIDKKLLKRCGFCGRQRNMRVHHLNANESDNHPKNLIGACHACNTQIGFLLKRHKIGRAVEQTLKPFTQISCCPKCSHDSIANFVGGSPVHSLYCPGGKEPEEPEETNPINGVDGIHGS
jgi:hypothetical protein